MKIILGLGVSAIGGTVLKACSVKKVNSHCDKGVWHVLSG